MVVHNLFNKATKFLLDKKWHEKTGRYLLANDWISSPDPGRSKQDSEKKKSSKNNILLMENIRHQLRLVVFPIIYRVSNIPGGAGFLPSTVFRSHEASNLAICFLLIMCVHFCSTKQKYGKKKWLFSAATPLISVEVKSGLRKHGFFP